MKGLISVLLISILAAPYASALRARRAADPKAQDTGVISAVGEIVDMTKEIPIIGSFISFGTEWMSGTMSALGDFNNGLISRILGGALPCVISKDGTTCSGVNNEGNIASLIKELLDQSPMPSVLKNTVYNVLSNTIDPIMNMIFGGVSITSA